MDIFKMLSDIAAVIKKPSGNTSADKKSEKPAVFPVVSDNPKPDTEVQNNELRLTFKEAQQAGFQFCYTRKKQVIITSIHVKSEKIIIPAYIDNHPVVRIADSCRPIVEPNMKNAVLVFPDTLTEIGDRAFMVSSSYHSKKLWHPVFSEIYFPNSVRIGVCAFYGQSGLKKLHFGEFADIYKEAFRYCDGLEKVSFQKCWLSRGSFMHCKMLSEVSFKAAVSTGGEVFYGTPFEEKQKLLIIGDALQRCRTDKKIFTVPDGVKSIGENAFENNKALERVILPSSVKIIKRRAFAGCENLWDIDLSHVEWIYSDAFENCRSLDRRVKFGRDTEFRGYPFTRTALENESVTKDGIVINGVLFCIRLDISGSRWQISDNVRIISGDMSKYDLESRWSKISGMEIVFPENVTKINDINLFSFAKRLTFKNPNVQIYSSKGFPLCNSFRKNITLTFITGNVSSDIPIVFPKNIGDNPAYRKTAEFYDRVFDGRFNRFDINIYDEGILDTGLPMDMLIDIAYKRLVGGYKLTGRSRTRYEEYLRLHIRRAVKYAKRQDNTEMLCFLGERFHDMHINEP
ncbi:MAG: leucine-rich repeat domain-containing protein [Oscillospiraceae bacterium]|nr:leucine-rich repeat domain-containing protein [Oscillospiraceae bacterium]